MTPCDWISVVSAVVAAVAAFLTIMWNNNK